MRKFIAAAIGAAVAVGAFTGTAEAAPKPAFNQVWVLAKWKSSGSKITGLDVKVSRTDHKSPKGLRVCVQERTRTHRAPVTLGCGTVDKNGTRFFKHTQRTYGGEQWRTYHPAGQGLAASYGRWVNGTFDAGWPR
ncbi:hypothetical protein [Actinoallomurus sp. NPDC052274]|uniref:hypothetical protein n=1 Tax=Actinoallomurus sp. NPDC052274 TaxID=3155420 RepID=UPI0034414EAD